MNTIIPIFLPNFEEEEPKCPRCIKPEDKRITCFHCGYEYEKKEKKFVSIILFILLAVLVIWQLATILFSLAEWLSGYKDMGLFIIWWENTKYIFTLKLF